MAHCGVLNVGLRLARAWVRQKREHQTADRTEDDKCGDDNRAGDSVGAPQPRKCQPVEALATPSRANLFAVRRNLRGKLTRIVGDGNGKRALATRSGTIRLRWSVFASWPTGPRHNSSMGNVRVVRSTGVPGDDDTCLSRGLHASVDVENPCISAGQGRFSMIIGGASGRRRVLPWMSAEG